MDKIQKDWLLQTFFKNEKYVGWKSIAEKLIDTGKCVTTELGDNIWIGGVGNFISSKPYEAGVGLIELTFNREVFISTDNLYFLEEYQRELNRVSEEQEKLIEYATSIGSIINL